MGIASNRRKQQDLRRPRPVVGRVNNPATLRLMYPDSVTKRSRNRDGMLPVQSSSQSRRSRITAETATASSGDAHAG
jgi:hypothetical protein